MEEIYKINSNISPPPSSESPEEKHTTIYIATVLVVAFIGIVFYMAYNNAPEDVNSVKEERVIYTHEEKLEILEGLASNPEDIPSIEERRVILSEIAENKQADAKVYSQEEKLNILYSLQ